MWKDRILSTFTATMRFIMADNILEVFMDQLSLTMKWKYLHTAAQHTLVALPFISHTFQLRISFKSWQTQESIYQSKSFFFLFRSSHKFMMTKRFFSSQSLILLYLFCFFGENKHITLIFAVNFYFRMHLFFWRGLKMMVEQKKIEI